MTITGIKTKLNHNNTTTMFISIIDTKLKKEILAGEISCYNHDLKRTLQLISAIAQNFKCYKIYTETATFNPYIALNTTCLSGNHIQRLKNGYAHVRALCLQRANHRSELSNSKSKQLQLHHITPRSNGGYDHPTNLIVLTPEEHQAVHNSNLTIPLHIIQKIQKSIPAPKFLPGSIIAILLSKLYPTGTTTSADISTARTLLKLPKSPRNDAIATAIAGANNNISQIKKLKHPSFQITPNQLTNIKTTIRRIP